MEYTLKKVIEQGIDSYIPNKQNVDCPNFGIIFTTPAGDLDWEIKISDEIGKRGFAVLDINGDIIDPEAAPEAGWLHRDDCICDDCADCYFVEDEVDVGCLSDEDEKALELERLHKEAEEIAESEMCNAFLDEVSKMTSADVEFEIRKLKEELKRPLWELSVLEEALPQKHKEEDQKRKTEGE